MFRLFPILLIAVSAGAETLRLDADRCVQLALQNNRAIAAARARLDEAAAGRGAALGAMLPQINATAAYTRLGTVNEFTLLTPVYGRFPLRVYDPATGQVIGYTDSIAMPIGADTSRLKLGSADNVVLRATVQQTLFTWGKLLGAYRIAGLTAEIQRLALQQARADVKIQAIEAFWRAKLARAGVALLTESRSQLDRHVRRVQALYDNGLATRLDLLRASVGLTNLRAQLAQAENGARLAEAALRSVIGISDTVPIELADTLFVTGTPVSLDSATELALSRRPELAQLRRALRIARIGKDIARTANLPTAFAQFNYDYKNPVGFTPGWGDDWNVTAGLSWPVFAGGSNLAKLRQARARERQALISLEQVEEAIRLEVKAQTLAVAAEAENVAYHTENVSVARTAVELAETRYANGLLTNLEYLDAQLALMQAEMARLNALASYRIALARLARATGETTGEN